MKKLFLASALSIAAFAALATETINPVGLGVGFGLGQAAASSTATADVRNQVGIANNVGIGLSTGANTAFGGASGATATSMGGTGVGGNATAGGAVVGAGAGAVSVVSNYKQAAAGAYAPRPSGPATSCRLFVGLGGTNVNGSLSGGIPIGNDQTCLSDKKLTYMDFVNSQFAGTFNKGDYLEAVCAIEGMDATEGCVAYKSSKAPVVQPALPAGYTN